MDFGEERVYFGQLGLEFKLERMDSGHLAFDLATAVPVENHRRAIEMADTSTKGMERKYLSERTESQNKIKDSKKKLKELEGNFNKLQDRPTKVAAIVGHYEKGEYKYLMISQLDAQGDSQWKFPGGEILFEETPLHALIRSFFDFTGANVSAKNIVPFLCVDDTAYYMLKNYDITPKMLGHFYKTKPNLDFDFSFMALQELKDLRHIKLTDKKILPTFEQLTWLNTDFEPKAELQMQEGEKEPFAFNVEEEILEKDNQ